jgi:long-subunit acyl-CoA synthetase (AMP-forming)
MKNEKSVPPRELGEVWIRGPNVMKEYWGDPAATSKAITRDGWFRTGDLGFIDEEGFLYICDRSRESCFFPYDLN